MAGLKFPFIKELNSYVKPELLKRRDPNISSKMKPWIHVTSNLYPQFTLSSTMYDDVFYGGNGNASYPGSGLSKGRPRPIVTEFSIDFQNRSVLRKGTLKIKCFSMQQFEAMQKFFMEPGISIFVQWGWNLVASDGSKDVQIVDTSPKTQLQFYRKGDSLDYQRENYKGCYDNMLGIVNKAQSSVNNEEFTISTQIVSLGEILYGKQPEGVEDTTQSETWKKEAIVYNNKTILKYREGDNKSRAKVNWCYFFNQLPDQFRNAKIQLWGKDNTNHFTDFIGYDEPWMQEMQAVTSNQSGDAISFYGKRYTSLNESNPIYTKKYLKFSTFINLLNEIRPSKGKTDLVDYFIGIGTRDYPVSLVGSFSGIFSCNDTIFIPNDSTTNWFKANYWYADADKDSSKTLFTDEYIDNSIKNLSQDIPFGEKKRDIISFPYRGTGEVSFTILEETYKFPANSVGWIGDVYIENDIAMEALRNINMDIKDTLDTVLKKMSDGVDGFWNFQLIEDNSDGYKLRIVDANLINKLNADSGDKGEENRTFDLYGENSTFLSFNFDFDLPKGMSNRIIALKSATDKTTSTQTGLRSLFSDKQDMVLNVPNINSTRPQFLPSKPIENIDEPFPIGPLPLGKLETTNIAKGEGQESLSPEEKALQYWEGLTKSSKLLVQPSISLLGNPEPIDFLSAASAAIANAANARPEIGISNVINGLDQPTPYRTVQDTVPRNKIAEYFIAGISDNTSVFNKGRKIANEKNELASSGLLNIKISFTVLGISGFTFGQIFSVRGLPPQYNKDNGYFQVTETKHKVDDRVWTTEVTAMFRPYYKP